MIIMGIQFQLEKIFKKEKMAYKIKNRRTGFKTFVEADKFREKVNGSMGYSKKNKFFVEYDNSKKDKKKAFIEKIEKKGEISEKELLLVKRRLNDGTYKSEDVNNIAYLKLTPEQQDKGFKYLYKQGFGKTGKTLGSSPYAYREEEALRTFKKIELVGFTNIGRMDSKNYVPVYRVQGKDTSFEYYVQGGKPNIIG